jgi:hypothetical protein
MRPIVLLLLAGLALVFCAQLQAMDRWSALSQIESGDNDRAVGAAGEVSRYQIKPDVWQRYATADASWEDPKEALTVAQAAMKERCARFERDFGRAPTDFEFYILWNAPARVDKPSATVSERARRFCNLIENR